MKDEQDRNEKALLYLRRRLAYPNRYLIQNKFEKIFIYFKVFYQLQVIFHFYHILVLIEEQLVMVFGKKI